MRIIIGGDELLELEPGSVIIPTHGRALTMDRTGWWRTPGDLLGMRSAEVADGKPIVVLFDAGAPTESLDVLSGMAQEAVNTEDVMSEGLAAYDFMVCWNRQHRYPELGEGRHFFEIPVRATGVQEDSENESGG